jgi:trimethylamine--corrinoid protein Co-methyltransferase
MRTATCIYGCPEYRLALSACADLYHYYGLPMWGTAGASDSNCLDQQASMEWTASIMVDALNGANLIHDLGYLGQGLIGHPGALVMCSEIVSYIKRFIKGFDIDDTHIGLEENRQVGPGGNFLASKRTAHMVQQEHWYPQLMNRDGLEKWARNGSKDWGQNATERAREILKSHQPEPLDEAVQQHLDTIRAEALSTLANIRFPS